MTSGLFPPPAAKTRLRRMPPAAPRIDVRIDTAALLRAAGLAVWLLVVVIHMASLRPPPDGPARTVFLGLQGLILVLLVTFAVCFWRNLEGIPVEHGGRRRIGLLLAQAASGALVSMDLLYLVAAEAPLVLSRRQALAWLAGQSAFVALWTLALELAGGAGGEHPLLARDPRSPYALWLMAMLTWQLFAFCAGWFAAAEGRQRRRLARLAAELVAAQQALGERERNDERLRIARELHDSAGHHLVALGLQLELAQRVAEPARGGHVATAAGIAGDLLADLRRVVGVLREEPPTDLPRALAALQAAVPEPRVRLDLPATLPPLAPGVAVTLLRCAQEAVANSLRHARARDIGIALDCAGGTARLRLRDDGVGCAALAAGNGLTGMRERVVAAGGTLAIDTAPGRGFGIEIALPLAAAP